MAPGLEADFTAVLAELCPRFVPIAPVRARKSELLAGELDGAPAIAKRLARPNDVWAWYLARELALYRAFAAAPPPVRVPHLHVADAGVLIIERLPGPPLAARRNPSAALAPADVAALVDARRALATWAGPLPALPAPPSVHTQLRTRLLEDPTAPLGWVTDGIARCGRRAILDPDAAARINDALAAHDRIAMSHGDLLLRNTIRDGAQIGLVDWECGGLHPEDWDLALLWIQLAPPSRAPIEREVRTTTARWRAFRGLVAFALAREVSILLAFRADPGPVRAALAEVEAEFS